MGNETVIVQNSLAGRVSPYFIEMIDAIAAAAAEYYGVTEKYLLNSSSRDMVRPRQLCFYLVYKNADLSSYLIGQRFNRTRNPVDYGISLIDAQKNIYRQVLVDLVNIAKAANNFEKKFNWNVEVK